MDEGQRNVAQLADPNARRIGEVLLDLVAGRGIEAREPPEFEALLLAAMRLNATNDMRTFADLGVAATAVFLEAVYAAVEAQRALKRAARNANS